MTAFGSHCDKNSPAFQNSVIIATANSAFSFVSGICLFGILGYLSTVEGSFQVKAGPALLFGVYPAGLSTIPFGLQWVRFLFLNLILLGLDSAFALVEAIVSVLHDSQYTVLSKPKLVAIICSLGFLAGLVYTTDAALHFLDVIDFYVNFIILFLGFCKSMSAGWVYGIRDQMDILGYNIVYAYMATTFGSLFLASLTWFGVAGNTVFLGFICLVVVYSAGSYYCYLKMKEVEDFAAGQSMSSMVRTLTMGNILNLKAELEKSVGYIPFAWAVVMKHVIPQVLLVLFFNLAFSKTPHGQWELGNYGDYLTWPFQILGLACVAIGLAIVFVGLSYSKLFEGFMKPMDSASDKLDEDIEMIDHESAAGYENMDDHENERVSDKATPQLEGKPEASGSDQAWVVLD